MKESKPTSNRKKLAHLFKQADMLGETKTFHIAGEGALKSASGASISVLIKLCLTIIFVKKTLDLVQRVDYQFYEIDRKESLDKDRIFT